MKKKQLVYIVIALILTNCLTIAYFLTELKSEKVMSPLTHEDTKEVVAKIGNDQITRETWLYEIEQAYGKEVLEALINEKVTEKLKEKYDIKVNPIEVERELRMIKMMYAGTINGEVVNEEEWKKQIENNIVIEEIITKDVAIDEEEMKKYYEDNKVFYDIPDAYHLSHIVVKTLEEAEQVGRELAEGSNYKTLALEWSIDPLTASLGGDIGFIAEGDSQFPEQYIETAQQLKPNEWSGPVQTNEGYAILLLHEHVEGVTYTYDEMKNQIRRQIALKQLDAPMTIQSFWDEIGVEWFYGNANG